MSTKIPRDAQVIQAILKDMGIIEYEPRVINQLLEFIYRYVTTVLDDAKAYANHAKKKGIDLDDVKLAVSMQMEQSFTSPPPREILMEVARSKNSIPLPSVKPHCGIRLPPDCHCLAACNYKLKTIKKTLPKSSMALSGSTQGSRMGMLGAGRAVHRPNSPAVRVTTINSGTPSTPRPLVKINAGSTSAPANVPKIQIAFPAQPNQPAEKMDMDARGVKRGGGAQQQQGYGASSTQQKPTSTYNSNSNGNKPSASASPYEQEQPPMPYEFAWAVKDEPTKNDYGHEAKSDGKVVTGSYRVLLPDGRTQIVSYRADENGYVADVKYEGEAQFPAPSSGNGNYGNGNGSGNGSNSYGNGNNSGNNNYGSSNAQVSSNRPTASY